MKKILGISLCALFAVSAANADIASTAYVDGLVGGIDTTGIGVNAGNIATNTSNISALTTRVSTNETNIQTNTGDIATNAGNITANANAINGINATIEGLELTETTGNYVKVVSQAGGRVSATPGSFEEILDSGTTDNAPTSKAVANYVADNAIQSVRSGTNNGTIIVDETAVSVAGLKALAYKDKVAAGDINPGAIVDADVSDTARIATKKIAFSDVEKAALGSTITLAKVNQIETNTDSIGDIQDFLDTMINEAPGYADCISTADGCTLVLSSTGYKWEAVKR